MAINRPRKKISYGVGQPLYDLSPQPISSSRAPTTADFTELGTVWVRKSTNQAWILASIASNTATWTPITVNAGATIDTGNLTITTGDLTVTAGDIDISAGDLGVEGSITVTSGDITIVAGDLEITAGGMTAATTCSGAEVTVTGDLGGQVGTVSFSNIVDEVVSTGAGTVLMTTANPGNSSGWLKIYNGTDARYIPYWSDIAP